MAEVEKDEGESKEDCRRWEDPGPDPPAAPEWDSTVFLSMVSDHPLYQLLRTPPCIGIVVDRIT
jgi:hypothetical protein